MSHLTQEPPALPAVDAERIGPQMLPDIATQAHPSVPAEPAIGAGENQLQNVLPEIKDLAQKVGGYKKLSELVDTLNDVGQ